jgi:putative hydrolases of HD superfamily
MSMMTFLIKDASVNRDRLLKVCLVHDLAESIVGDITPYDGVSKEDKKRMELDAMKKIVNDLGDQEIADDLMSLWLEYEEGESVEGEIARQLDKYEMIVQADEYEKAQNKRLDSFFKYTEGFFTHPEVKAWADALVENRNARLNSAKKSEEVATGTCGNDGNSNSSSSGSPSHNKKQKTEH